MIPEVQRPANEWHVASYELGEQASDGQNMMGPLAVLTQTCETP